VYKNFYIAHFYNRFYAGVPET